MAPETPWYERAFTADYLLRYPHRNEDEAARAVAGLIDPIGFAGRPRCLDLCCGGGRHARVLVRRGFSVIGLDLSQDLLRSAVSIACSEGLPFQGIRGTMDCLPFRSGSFGLVVNFFTAFGYFEDDTQNFRVFTEVSRVLTPDGWFVFDFLDAVSVRTSLPQSVSSLETIVTNSGRSFRTMRRLSPDGRRVEKHLLPVDAEGRAVGEPVVESVRLFEPDELRQALQACGFAITREASGYSPGCNEGRWIAVCRRGGG